MATQVRHQAKPTQQAGWLRTSQDLTGQYLPREDRVVDPDWYRFLKWFFIIVGPFVFLAIFYAGFRAGGWWNGPATPPAPMVREVPVSRVRPEAKAETQPRTTELSPEESSRLFWEKQK